MKSYYVKLGLGAGMVMVSAWLLIGYRMSNSAPTALAVNNPSLPNVTAATPPPYNGHSLIEPNSTKDRYAEGKKRADAQDTANKKTYTPKDSTTVQKLDQEKLKASKEALRPASADKLKKVTSAPAVVSHERVAYPPKVVTEEPAKKKPVAAPVKKTTPTHLTQEEPCDEPTPGSTVKVAPSKTPVTKTYVAPTATPVAKPKAVKTKVVKTKHTVVLAQTTHPTVVATPRVITIPHTTDLPSTGPEAGVAISLVGAAAGLVWRKSQQLS